MKPNFTLLNIFIILLCGYSVMGQTINLSKTVDNITTGTSATIAAQNHILEYTINITNLSGSNITASRLFDNIPAGSVYLAGSTFLNGVNVADISGSMPYSGAGSFVQSPASSSGLLRPNTPAVVKFRVRVTANGGNITNYAVLECVYQSSNVVQSTNTVFTNLTPDPTCSQIFQSTSSTENGVPQSPSNRPYRYIKLLNTANGTGGATIYDGATGACFNAVTGASMANGSVLTYASAIAYDKASNRIYFVNNNSATPQDLSYVDLNSTPVSAKKFIGYPLETTTGAGYNVNRMSFASDGFGYGITENGRDIIRFSMDPVSGLPVISRLGNLLNASSNGTMDILNEKGGDIFGDGSGNLYLVANSSNLYKINPNTRISTFLGSVNPFPGTSNSISVDAAGNVFIGGAYQNVFNVNLATMNASSITGGNTSNVWTNGDYTSCAFPVLAPALTANKTYSNLNGLPFVIGGDTIEYRIEVLNTGNINAAGVRLYDGIPLSTNYIPNSTRLNGVLIPDVSGAMPYSVTGGALINTTGELPGIIKPGNANRVIMTFRAKISPGNYICNQSRITLLDDNGNTMWINSDDPTQTGGQNPTCFYSDGVLPATNISFTGSVINGVSHLRWKVSNDQDVFSYEIEYSEDGLMFTNIGSLHSKNNGAYDNTYTFEDKNSSQGKRFYRLRLQGKNKLHTYSKTVTLASSNESIVSVLPNPFIQQVTVSLQLRTAEQITIRLIDLQGNIIRESRNVLTVGNHQVRLDIDKPLMRGVYILEAFAGTKKLVQEKLVRQ